MPHVIFFFFSSRRRHTRWNCDWSSDVCSSDLRVYDPTIHAWRIYWIDPARNTFRQQIGRQRGLDIIQEGKTETGALSRWSFTNITPHSFHWLGESSASGDSSWQLVVEVLARRRAA